MVNLTANHAPQTVTDYTTISSFEFSPAGRSDCILRAFFIANKQKKQQFINNSLFSRVSKTRNPTCLEFSMASLTKSRSRNLIALKLSVIYTTQNGKAN